MAKATGWQAPTRAVTSIPKVPIVLWCFDPMPRKSGRVLGQHGPEVVVRPTVEEVEDYGDPLSSGW